MSFGLIREAEGVITSFKESEGVTASLGELEADTLLRVIAGPTIGL